jgi:hypothetical protein
MAPSKKDGGSKKPTSSSKKTSLPAPFKTAPENLQPFTLFLSKKHVYIAHIDSKPWAFKRKMFAVPVLINIVVVLLCAWRVYYIGPFYWNLMLSGLGHANETTVRSAGLTWGGLISVILQRGFTFLLDFCLTIFVWSWPVEFCFGRANGSPVQWRMAVGFQDKEIYVRRSRTWDQHIGDVLENGEGRNILMSYVRLATTPMLLQEKTGYLTMNGEWDLDWAAMVKAHKLVDEKVVTLDTFRTLVLLHHRDFGWICIDMNLGENAKEDERRRQVFAFRDALAAVGKEELFFRWIEIIQFESSQPDGFGPEKQMEVAQKIRDLFKDNDVDFDELWRESVGSDGLAGMI